MTAIGSIKKYYNFCSGIGHFLRHPLLLEKCESLILERLKLREETFLQIAQKAIYGNTKNPYYKLLQWAGYSYEDLCRSVKDNGIDAALKILARDGIYITYEEFKGLKPLVRGGHSVSLKEVDFDNPFTGKHFDVKSGGTTGPGTRTMIDFDFLTYEAAHRALVLNVYGLLDAPAVLWYPILPGNAGLQNVFRQAKINRPPTKWFSQVDKRTIKPSFQDRAGTHFIILAGRLFGSAIPIPVYANLQNPKKIVQALREILQQSDRCSVWTYANSAVRICLTAQNSGLRLSGVSFFISGEPITETKLNEIRSTGADAVPYYAFVEGGIIAYGCQNPNSADDMHYLSDRIAIITKRRKPKQFEQEVDSLLFTSLIPEAPKILLNVETGDYGSLENRKCDCGFERYGFNAHIHHVKSFEKLTSEGMTFMIKDLIAITEHILPNIYGGSCSDYQIQETSDGRGISSLSLVISPRVGQVNETEVISRVLHELKKNKQSRRLMGEIWEQAGTLSVKRADPMPTQRGKIHSFHRGRENPC